MTQPLRVLIAEDDVQDAKLILLELRRAGFEPEWQHVDSEDAYRTRLGENWDVILSDFVMPQFSGLRALELLKESGLDIPFIIVSGTIGEEDAVAAMKLGASDYLIKDRLGRLGAAINQAIEKFRLRRERSAADQALRESEERFREVVQNIEEVFWMTNVERTKMLFVSAAYEKIWGRSCQSLYDRPMTWIDSIRPDDQNRVSRAALASQVENTYLEEYRIIRPDGTIRWINDRGFPVRNANGVIYRIAGVAADITERKQAELALCESEKQLTLITNNVPCLIAYMDRNFTYRFVNNSYEKLFDMPREKIVGSTIRQTIGEDGYSRVEPYLKRVMAGETVTFENYLSLSSGILAYFIITYVPDVSPNGSVNGLFSVVNDITQFKSAEEALRKSEEQLAQSQKMEAIGQLAGGVAHDFNNQLSVILGYADVLSKQALPENLRQFASHICDAARRSAELTQKLLVFARKGQAKLEPVNLHAILAETITVLNHTVDKRITLVQALEARSVLVTGNESQLQNALLNLGINARDAMPDGGTLTYKTENVSLDSNFCASRQNQIEPGEYIRISVIDTGSGMSDDVKKHLFEPFFTTKPVGKGTGLGLAAVYGMVIQHAGTLTVTSAPGKGTAFQIYLPLAREKAPRSAKSSGQLKAIRPLRILAVDDEDILRTMLAYILTEFGHEVLEAENGIVAAAVYKHCWQDIDLVFLDMVMPEMNGHNTFLELKKINPDIKAVLLTGYSLNSEVQAILDAGVLDFIQKPFEPRQLREAIARVLEQ